MQSFPLRKALTILAIVTVGLALYSSASTASAASTLFVPTQYATIQAAVDAANDGDTIKVRPGTYVEQVSIDKDLTVTGAGAGSTIIRAPGTLVPGAVGNSIVDITGGASVAMSRLTVSGPGAGTCEDGPLANGIAAIEGAHLDLSFAAITHIHDTPLFNCFHSGHGIWIGDPFVSTGSATIRYSQITDYAQVGIIAFNEGSNVTISHNVIAGAGQSTVVANGGIELIFGAAGTVSDNIISGNACGSPDLGCGPDFFNEFQVAGIAGGGPGTVISRNLLFGNQVGIYVGDSAEISRNLFVNNDYFGIALQDGSFTVKRDLILGGVGGVAVIAAFADTEATLDHVNIAGTSGPRVRKFECCGFTATVNIQ